MGLIRRPLPSRHGLSACRLVRAPPQRLGLSDLPSYTQPRSDYPSFFAAELSDALYCGSASSREGGALTTDRRRVMETDLGWYVLNPKNSATWLPVLGALHLRGALRVSDRVAAQRFLPATTFQELFPWLWGDAGDDRERAGAAATSAGCPQAHGLVASTADIVASRPDTTNTPSEPLLPQRHKEQALLSLHNALSELRRAPPDRWVRLVKRVYGDVPADPSRALSEAASLDRIQSWQEVFFALSVNPAFGLSAEQLSVAHTSLLQEVDLYYADCVALQSAAAPLTYSGGAGRGDSPDPRSSSAEAGSSFRITRMPPAVLHQWKTLYRTHYALLKYAELLNRVILGEEAVAAAAEARVAGAREEAERGSRTCDCKYPATLPERVTTAVLEDDELLLFYVTIPGRRECGLGWEAQWQLTVQHARFAFARLFKSRLLAQQPPSAAVGKGSAGATDGIAVLRRAARMLMNVCMWVRNNNAEGARCLEVTHALLEEFLALSPNGATVDAARTWSIVQVLREAALAAMLGKAQRLQYACSGGLFDVAAAAAALEILRPSADSVITPRDVHILLHERKALSAASVWAAAVHHPSSPLASRYGLLSVGLPIAKEVVQAAGRRVIPRGALRRVGQELRAWAELVGHPLHLRAGETQSLWYGQVVKHGETGATEAAWADVMLSRSDRDTPESVAGDRPRTSQSPVASSVPETWTCGCGSTSTCGAGDRSVVPACAACVLRSCFPHSWQCPRCLHTANSGEPTAVCLHCGTTHPALLARREAAEDVPDSAKTLFVCEDCHGCSLVDPGRATAMAGDGPVGCGACGGTRGYVRGFFRWRCGCGVANPPTHSHCASCTRHRAEIIAEEEETAEKKLPESPPAIAEVAPDGFTAVYQCVFCQHDVAVTAAAVNEHGPGLYAECTHCSHPHPRHLASVEEGRLVSCPACQSLVSADVTACPTCGSNALGTLRPLLVAQTDQPWRCHSCGHDNPLHVRGRCGCESRSGEGRFHDTDACAQCGVRRVPAALWELGRRWSCGSCGSSSNYGVTCRHCHALAPAVPPDEVHVWRCTICRTTLNGSWQGMCTLPGCGGRHADSLEAQQQQNTRRPELPEEAEDALWVLSYTPWECTVCGTANLSEAVTECSGCGSERDGEEATAKAAQRSVSTLRGLPRLNPSGAPSTFAVESGAEGDGEDQRICELRFPSCLSQHPEMPPVTMISPCRLTAVERLLADAADEAAVEETIPAAAGSGAPAAAPRSTDVAVVTSEASSGLGTRKGEGGDAFADGSRDQWEDGYRRAVFSL